MNLEIEDFLFPENLAAFQYNKFEIGDTFSLMEKTRNRPNELLGDPQIFRDGGLEHGERVFYLPTY